MSMNDPIADMFARLRNAQLAKHETTLVPASRHKRDILNVLKEEGFIHDVAEATDAKGHPALVVTMKYYDGKGVMTFIKRHSKPGLRQYSSSQDLPLVRNGLGINIVTTSKGVMTDAKARELNVGGEVLGQVF